ncbi:unnamed protein product, partial [Discosporangium mesarthrocarpum]
RGGRLLEPSTELEVLKCIMLREGYLDRLRIMAIGLSMTVNQSHGKRKDLPAGMTDLLDVLRISTVDTIEAILLWRLAQVKPTQEPFLWNKENYLAKILHDCDFLDDVEPLRHWLGFSLHRNPLLIPPGRASIGYTLDKPGEAGDSMVEIGHQPWQGPLLLPSSPLHLPLSKKKKKARPKQRTTALKALAPYAAPIINDPVLLPAAVAGFDSNTGAPAVDCMEQEDETQVTRVSLRDLVPNILSRNELQRVLAAEKALAEEELLHPPYSDNNTLHSPKAVEDKPSSAGNRRVLSHGNQHHRAGRETLDMDRPLESSYDGAGNCHSEFSPRGQQCLEKREHHIHRMTFTTARLLDRPPPEPSVALGPVLVHSSLDGEGLNPRLFTHSVSVPHGPVVPPSCMGPEKQPWESQGDRASPFEKERAGTGKKSRAGVQDTSAGGVGEQAGVTLTPLTHLTPPPSQGLASKHCLGNGQEPQGQDMPDHYRPKETQEAQGLGMRSGSAQLVSSGKGFMAGRRAGAELYALTAAGTTGRRIPPPREPHLGRLRRDVRRHALELQVLRSEVWGLRNTLGLNQGQGGKEEGHATEGGREGLGFGDGHPNPSPTVEVGVKAKESSEERSRNSRGENRKLEMTDFLMGDGAGNEDRMRALRARLVARELEIRVKDDDLKSKQIELIILEKVQRQAQEWRESLALERKRFQLAEGEVLPEDSVVAESVEYTSAVLIQKWHRGNLSRAHFLWYKEIVHKAASRLQAAVRSALSRIETKRVQRLNMKARVIQAAVRKCLQRGCFLRVLRAQLEDVAARKVLRVWRGMRGRRRGAARRRMVRAAATAAQAVSADNLRPSHLTELAADIHAALINPKHPFPPMGVLGALRAVLMVFDQEADVCTYYTALGYRISGEVSPSNLTWEMAMRVLRRPSRLLRRLQAFVDGLGGQDGRCTAPPRLLSLTPAAVRIIRAYDGDPDWASKGLRRMKAGRTAATALVRWARGLDKFLKSQELLEDFVRDSQPSWLRISRSFQRRRRALELKVEGGRQAVTTAQAQTAELEKKGRAFGVPLNALKVLQDSLAATERELTDLMEKRMEFAQGQVVAEAEEEGRLQELVEVMEREVFVAQREVEVARGTGLTKNIDLLLQRTRDREIDLREGRRRMSETRRRRLGEKAPLMQEWIPPPEDQMAMARMIGTAKAWMEIMHAQWERKTRSVNQAGGLRFIKGLRGHELEIAQRAKEGILACNADVEAGEVRLALAVAMFEGQLQKENEAVAAEKVSTLPWDNATAETATYEREEDAAAAEEESLTVMGTSLPPGLLEDCSPSRVRPTLLLLSLDLPAAVRQSIRARLDADAPGLFCHLFGVDATVCMNSESLGLGGEGVQAPAWATNASSATAAGLMHTGGGKETVSKATLGVSLTVQQTQPWRSCDTTLKRGQPSQARALRDAISGGKNLSIEVDPGLCLWRRGRFLRDLEVLLEGADGGHATDGAAPEYLRPSVVLLEGDHGNRSGGGAEVEVGSTALKQG